MASTTPSTRRRQLMKVTHLLQETKPETAWWQVSATCRTILSTW